MNVYAPRPAYGALARYASHLACMKQNRTLGTEVLTVFVGELGCSLEPEIDVVPDALELEHPALANGYGAAARGIDLLGARAGQPPVRLVDPLAGRPTEPVALVAGFNVHAKLVVDGRDRNRHERI